MALFDNSGPALDPATAGLLSAAFAGLQASGPSLMPRSLGQVLGAAGQSGLGAYSNTLNTNRQLAQADALVNLEKAKQAMVEQQLAQDRARFALQQGLLNRFMPPSQGGPGGGQGGGGPTPAGMSPSTSSYLFGSPQFATPPAPQGASQFPLSLQDVTALKLAGMPDLLPNYQASQPDVIVQDGIVRNKKGGEILGTQPIMTPQGLAVLPRINPDGSYSVTGVQGANDVLLGQARTQERARAERDLIPVPATSPNAPPTYRSRESLLGGNAPAGMSPIAAAQQAADAEQAKKIGENYAKVYNDLQNASMSNPGKIAKFNRIGDLLGNFEGGKLSETGADLASLGNSLGVKIDPKLPNKQAAQALTNEVALELRSTGEGAGMPGAMSNSDRDFLKQMTPQLGQTAEGRKLVIDSRVKMLERESQVARMAREYKQKYGKMDENFFSQLQVWSESHPVFGQK